MAATDPCLGLDRAASSSLRQGGPTRKDNQYYDIFPRIVRAGQESEVTLRPLYDHVRMAEPQYRLLVLPLEGARGKRNGSRSLRSPLPWPMGLACVDHFAGSRNTPWCCNPRLATR